MTHDIEDMVQQCLRDGEEWFGMIPKTFTSVLYHVLGLVGEAGEVADLLKKSARPGAILDETKLREELTDVFVHWLNLVGQLDMDIEKEYDAKRAINIARFGTT